MLYHFPILLKQVQGQIVCNCVLIFCSLLSKKPLWASVEEPFSLQISKNMCLRCTLLPSSFQFFKISRSSEEVKRHEDGGQEGGVEITVEVDEKW